MRKSVILALLFVLGATAATVDSLAGLRTLFPKPPAEFSTAPFFVWNGEITEAMIDRELHDFSTQGVHAFIIHPRPGLITEYLSPRWFQLMRYTLDQAKKLGMQMWLYDEDSYPSGFGGGYVPAEMPESYNQGQGLALRQSGPCKILLQRVGDHFEDVTGKAEPSGAGSYCFALTEYPPGAWYAGYSYVDIMIPEVTKKFLAITMPGYEKAFGADLGKTVPGIFSDEAHINSPGRNDVRYTPALFDRFQKRWGYDLKTNLPSLVEEVGDWRRVRHDYYSVLLDLFVEGWSKPYSEYTASKGLVWTGHYWEHAWPSPANGPDNMAMYVYPQMPGIDMLRNQFNEGVGAQFGNVRSVKELASVANEIGQHRTLSETYGAGGWDLRFEDMKRLGDWEYALGVTFMNQHLSYGTLDGVRKYDYPQSFSYHAPWWKHYGVLGDYFARLSLALSAGDEVNRILVIEPTTSAWMYAGSRPNARMMEIGNAFQAYITGLSHNQVEYDIGSEYIIRDHGSVAGKQFVVGKRSYDAVVLPPGTESLDAVTTRLMRQYIQNGGKLTSYVSGPLLVDGVPGGLSVSQQPEGPANPDITGVEGTLLFHMRRRLKDGELWFFANSSLDAEAAATVKAPGKSLEKFDPITGRTAPYPAKVAAGSLEFSVALPPAGSLMVVAKNVPGPAVASVPPPAAGRPVPPTAPLTVARTAPNALRIDYCDLTLNGVTQKDVFFFKASDAVFKAVGFPAGDPWNSSVQFKTSTVDHKFAPDAGFEATFWVDVAEGVDTASMRAVVERPPLWKVSVNGNPVDNQPGQWYLDVDFGTYAIGRYIKPGRNSITLVARPMSVHNELEPVHIIGEFGVTAQDKGFRIVPASPLKIGSWKDQNLPFYPDSVSYTGRFNLASGAKYKVVLGKWAGTVSEVRVNGKSAGIIGWQPYELPIDGLVKSGPNVVEVVVTGSLKNLLGAHHGNIQRGAAGPSDVRNAPANMPPGASYDQLPYGLMEDFKVVPVKEK
jgi:hypothetical protein